MSTPELFDRYLNILGIVRRSPDYDYLCEVVQAHLIKIKFENLSKLYYKNQLGLRAMPELELYLDGIERYNFGGTCYTNNNFLNQLLNHLGFDAALCGCDMNNPDVHLVNIVRFNDGEFIVDTGYAAPFIKPLPRNLDYDYIIVLGHDRYELRPQDENGNSRIDMYRDNELIHGYTAKPKARDIEFFSENITKSFSEESVFMNSLLIVKFECDSSLRLHNLTVTESKPGYSHSYGLDSKTEQLEFIETKFQIPQEITSIAIEGLDLSSNPWS